MLLHAIMDEEVGSEGEAPLRREGVRTGGWEN